MATTIKVNGTNLSLVHKGSGGIVKSTLPDVCKTPSPGGPVPIPYPVIISLSADLKDGTKTVMVDGGNPAAVKGSQLSRCTGDEPGTAGGIKSGTQLKEATWLSYSFDVMMEGRNVCRLSDKLLMNKGNTACLAGILQPAILIEHAESAVELQILCDMMCEERGPGRKQDRIAERLQAMDAAVGGRSTMKAEVPYNPSTREPYMSNNEPWRATRNFFIPGHRRPDVIITDGSPPTFDNIRTVVEMKFDDGDTGQSERQIRAYKEIFGSEKVVVMEEGQTCICEENDGETEPVPQLVPEQELETKINWWLVSGSVILGVATVVATAIPFDGPFGEAALGTATAATWAAAFTRSRSATAAARALLQQ